MPVWLVWDAEQLLLPLGKRYDVLVTAGAPGTYPLTARSTHLGCVDCPEVTLAKLNVEGATIAPVTISSLLFAVLLVHHAT